MFYKLTFDMDRIDESIKDKTNMIYAETTNMDAIEYGDIKKGFFDNIILSKREIENWPNVEFYYSSIVSNLESDFLLNVKRWPIIHTKVQEIFEKAGISGVEYLPIKLVDVVTDNVNSNYVLMYVKNFIEAYDMEKSKYRYNDKYSIYTFAPNGIVLNKNVCINYDIFRCNFNVATLYTSEKIKKLAEENQWIGFEFYKQI